MLFATILAMALGAAIPAECPQPILSYQYADSGREPTFGCFISKDAVCTHGKGGADIVVTPLVPDDGAQEVYDVIENLAPASVDDYWVCDGQSTMPIRIYQVYKDSDPILLYRTNQDCLRIHRGPGVDLVKKYIDRVCQAALYAG